MPEAYARAERIDLKRHPEYSERWLQERLAEDPSLLGLGEVELLTLERRQHQAGRLDMLLHDEPLNRRYEVELMLGATDPSHIIRCIEYWDIERRRYPAYEHVAVLVAEDITSRFLNVMSLLAGSIPLIAIQLATLRVEGKVVLHFTKVLDQSTLREDDTASGGNGGVNLTNRAYWEQKLTPSILGMCDELLAMIRRVSGRSAEFRYKKLIMTVQFPDLAEPRIWLLPQKTLVRLGCYVDDPVSWTRRFEEAGLLGSLRRGGRAVLLSLTSQVLQGNLPLIEEFIQAGLSSDEDSAEA